jgi:hypothetical protein
MHFLHIRPDPVAGSHCVINITVSSVTLPHSRLTQTAHDAITTRGLGTMTNKIEIDAALSDEALDGVVGGNMWTTLFGIPHSENTRLSYTPAMAAAMLIPGGAFGVAAWGAAAAVTKFFKFW